MITTATQLVEQLEPICLGELHLTPEQFGQYTIGELEAMIDGYLRRRYALEDMFIQYVALPMYNAWYGKKAPSYKELTAYRKWGRKKQLPPMDPAVVEKWRKILQET